MFPHIPFLDTKWCQDPVVTIWFFWTFSILTSYLVPQFILSNHHLINNYILIKDIPFDQLIHSQFDQLNRLSYKIYGIDFWLQTKIMTTIHCWITLILYDFHTNPTCYSKKLLWLSITFISQITHHISAYHCSHQIIKFLSMLSLFYWIFILIILMEYIIWVFTFRIKIADITLFKITFSSRVTKSSSLILFKIAFAYY